MRNRFAIFATSAVLFLGSEDATCRNNFLRTIGKLLVRIEKAVDLLMDKWEGSLLFPESSRQLVQDWLASVPKV
jgi:hypothetical protein